VNELEWWATAHVR